MVLLMSLENYISIKKKVYTWRRKTTNIQARPDFFLLSEDLLTDVSDCKIFRATERTIPLYCWISTLANLKKDAPAGSLIIPHYMIKIILFK